ncbi:MAG TPA: RidA family protein [Solirubrobacteraceae bacterium]|jgi:enamine deaminase RidA (YjgF/YER057c/UK114 family)|nr:RidA family protein [Solirubrobacteraceae bacterium]
MSIERVETNPGAGFADAVTTVGPGRVVYVSGNVGFGPDGKVVAGGVGPESAATFDNIARVLREAGADFSHIVKINAFITDLDEYPAYASVRAERFGEELPASATVQVAGLLVGAHIEIDAVAFVPEG